MLRPYNATQVHFANPSRVVGTAANPTMKALLHFKNRYHRAFGAVPFTYGVPVPQGAARDASQIGLLDARGAAVPVSARVTATWANGSTRWALLDFVGDFTPSEKAEWTLVLGETAPALAPANPVFVEETDESTRVSNGLLDATFSQCGFSLFRTLRAGAQTVIDESCRCDIVAVNPSGKIFRASYDKAPHLSLEDVSPLRATVRWDGALYAGDGERLTHYRVKLHFYANNPYIKIEHSAICREAPERGVMLREYRIDLETCLARETTKTVRQKNHGADYLARLFQIEQNAHLVVPTTKPDVAAVGQVGIHGTVGKVLLEDESAFGEVVDEFPHFLQPGAPRVAVGGGYAVTFPFLGMGDDKATLVASFLRMGPQHPKGIDADENRLSFEVWPVGSGEWRLSRGMTKTHHLALSAFGTKLTPEQIEDEALRREYFAAYVPADPVQITLDPAYSCLAGAAECDETLPYLPEKYPRLETKIAGIQLHGKPLASSGMMDYGEAIATNNEEDQGHQYAMEFFRRGDYESYQKFVAQMLHNATVDVVDFDPDPLRRGGTPYHTHYHQDAVCVPSHTWTEGMFEYAHVTGDREAYRAAVGLCDWILRYLDGKPHLVKQDGREIGWPIVALVAGYEATWDKRYLDGAYRLVDCYREKVKQYGELVNDEPPGANYTLELYGEFAGFEGMHKLWRVTRDEELGSFALSCIESAFGHDYLDFHGLGRQIDLYAIYAAYDFSGDAKWLELAKRVFPIIVSRPDWNYYLYRRIIHFLGLCHRHDLIDDSIVSF